jgi:hypothetical protein
MTQESGPFIDFSKLTDEEIIDRLNKISARISYYFWTNYSYLVPQLQSWEEQYREELRSRAEKRRADKAKVKDTNIIFDNSEETLAAAKEKEDKEKAEKDKK